MEHTGVWSKDAARLDRQELTIVARSMVKARRALHGPIPGELIHDTALDILLNLYLSGVADERRALIDLAASSTTSAPVTNRWVKALRHHGFVAGSDDDLSLSGEGLDRMSEMLRSVVRSQWADS